MPDIIVNLEDRGDLGQVAVVTVDNRAKLNTLTVPLVNKFNEVMEELRENENLRVMILTGAGDRAFIGGVDINELARFDPKSAETFITNLHGVCAGIRNLPVPVIARISGYCLGGGLEIAASCDMRVATEGSNFGMPEVNVGVPSVIEAALLPQLVGWGKTRELVFTGRIISASEALSWGLVERVSESKDLDQAVEDWVQGIINAGPLAIRLQKKLIRDWESLPLESSIKKGIECFRESYLSDEPKVMTKMFFDKQQEKK